MNKYLATSILCALSCSFAICQNNNDYNDFGDANDMKKYRDQINSEKPDSTKAIALWSISGWFSEKKQSQDSAYYYIKKWYEFVKNKPNMLNQGYGKINALTYLSSQLRHLGRYSEAIKYSLELLKSVENENDKRAQNQAIKFLAQTYFEIGDYDNSVKYASHLKHLSEKDTIHTFYTKLDTIRLNFNPYFYPPSLELLGRSYLEMQILDSALFYFNKYGESIVFVKKLEEQITYWYDASLNMALYYFKKGDYSISESFLKKALVYFSPWSIENSVKCLQTLSQVYDKINKNDSCIYYLNSAYRLSKSESYSIGILTSSKFLSEKYEKIKNLDSALFYNKIYINLKDSLFSADVLKNVTIRSIEENIRQDEIISQKKAEAKSRTDNIKLSLIAVFIPIFALFVNRIRKTKKNNPKLTSILGVATLLMFFEFIALLIHPSVERLSNHDPVIMYILLLIIASILAPLHQILEAWAIKKS
jgi:hypothetical protein